MSTGPAATPPPAVSIYPLGLVERRVLGVLVEKAKTTPDAYPLSLNALVTGSNQKSNRDPVLDLAEDVVEDALMAIQQKGLTLKITGGRVERWKHMLYEAWRVNKVELAVLGELLLRGPQTEGELRTRASRMEPIDDLDALRALLKPLAERKLVVYLTEQGRRGTTVTHGFHEPAELLRLRHTHEGAISAAEAPTVEIRPARGPDLTEVLARVSALETTVAELRATVAELSARVRTPATPAPPSSAPGNG